jgi:outer membrane protein OmpA-like peptidoglycan-associated protein
MNAFYSVCMFLFLFLNIIIPSVHAQEEEIMVNAVAVDKKNVREPVIKIIREEIEATKFFPLLPYIFFEQGKADLIPDRYKIRDESTTEFMNIHALGQKSILSVYSEILNIIGLRLRQNKQAVIQLHGCTDGSENPAIAMQRAQTVKNYLQNIWHIESDRIKISAGTLPAMPSKSSEDKYSEWTKQENRRVEINGDWAIMQPFIVRDTEITTTPPELHFEMSTANGITVSRHMLLAWQGEKKPDTVFSRRGTALPDPQEYIWNLEAQEDENMHQPKAEAPVQYRLITRDASNRPRNSNVGNIEIEQRTLRRKKALKIGGNELFEYRLILFEYASAALTRNHKLILDMVKNEERIYPSSIVEIAGYADLIGPDDKNKEISAARA